MARSLSLRLIKYCLIGIFIIHLASAVVMEDFEDVSDWSCENDCDTFVTDATHVQEGSFAGKESFIDSDGFSSVCKDFDTTDFTGISNLKFYYWLDTTGLESAFIQLEGYENNVECGILEQNSPSNQTLDFVDFSQNTFNNIVTACNVLDEICLSINTQETNSPVWFDILTCTDCIITATCTAPASGDWIITGGDDCTLNVADTITGNLNISDGSLEIQGSGALTIQGGFIYIENGVSNNNLTILSGGQING